MGDYWITALIKKLVKSRGEEDTSPPALMTPVCPPSTAALCVAHPGHEIRVLEWVRCNRPITYVLTDGSGANRPSRFNLTEAVIQTSGGCFGSMRGRFPDRAIYQMMLQKDPAPFLKLCQELACEWISAGIETVAGDMMEGFNPSHDVCRIIINAAVEKVKRSTGRQITNLEFALEAMSPPPHEPGMIQLILDDEQFTRKRHAALTAYPALAAEVDRLISQYGEQVFRLEHLFEATPFTGLTWDEPEPPYYEVYGQRQIAAGHYSDLITFTEHIQPLAKALYAWARSDSKL